MGEHDQATQEKEQPSGQSVTEHKERETETTTKVTESPSPEEDKEKQGQPAGSDQPR